MENIRMGVIQAPHMCGSIWVALQGDKRVVHGLRIGDLDRNKMAQHFEPPCGLAVQGSLITFDDSLVTCKHCQRHIA